MVKVGKKQEGLGRIWAVVVNIHRTINLRICIITSELTTLYKVVNSCHYIYPAYFLVVLLPPGLYVYCPPYSLSQKQGPHLHPCFKKISVFSAFKIVPGT